MANLALLRQLQVITNMIVSASEFHFGFQISQPPNITQKWFCIQNLHMDLRSKKQFRNLFLGFRVIKQIQKVNFFLRRPVDRKEKSA